MAWRWGIAAAAAVGLSLLLLSQVGDGGRAQDGGAQRSSGATQPPAAARPNAGAVSTSSAPSATPAPTHPLPAPAPPSAEAPEPPSRIRVVWSGGLAATVRYPGGTPAIGAEVNLTYGGAEVRGLTDGAGLATLRYELATHVYPAPSAGVRAPIRQTVTVTALAEWDEAMGFTSRRVEVREGEEVGVTLELAWGFALDLRVDRPLGYGHSRVVGPDGTSSTVLWRNDSALYFSQTPGRYRVSLEGATPDTQLLYAEGETELGRAPRTTLLLRVAPLGRVAVRLLDVGGAPCEGWVTASREGWPCEGGLRFLNAERIGALGTEGPFDAGAPVEPAAPVELVLPPGRWRVTGAGLDPATAPVTRSVDVAGAGRLDVTLRLEPAPGTRVSFPPAVLDQEGGQLEVFLCGPPGASLAWCEDGVRIGGLPRGALARVVAVHLAEDDTQTVGVVLVRGGERARLELGGHGGLSGRVTGAEERETYVELVRAGEPAFAYGCGAGWNELREDARYAAEEQELGTEDGLFTTYVEALVGNGLNGEPLGLAPPVAAHVLGKHSFAFVDEGTPLGSFRFDRLPPGRYRVVLRDTLSDALLLEGPEVTIAIGETATLELAAPGD